MRTSKNLLLSASLTCALAGCLVACGGEQGADGADGKIGTPDTAIETPQTPAVQADWGHVVFDNDDGAYMLIDGREELQQIEDAFEGTNTFAEVDGRLERCYLAESSDTALLVFYFGNPGFANEEDILSMIKAMKGSDIHTEPVLDDGTKIYVATMPSGDSQNVLIFEIVDGEGLYLAALLVDSTKPHDGIDRISFTDGSKLSGYLAGNPGDSSAGGMRIGSDRNGYMDIPSTWITFKDMGDVDPNMIQYADGSSSIVSMLGIILSEEGYSGTAADYALSFAEALYEDHDGNEDVVDLNSYLQALECGLDSYIVATEWTDGTFMYQFCIAGDDRMYYIACEGDEDTALDMAFNVIETFDPAA